MSVSKPFYNRGVELDKTMNQTMMDQIINRISKKPWVWGGSLAGLMLAAVTRQAVLGVVPLAIMWQQQTLQMMQTQYHQQNSRWQKQFDALRQDCLGMTNGQHQPSQDRQGDLPGLTHQIKDLQNSLGRIQTQVGQINTIQGSLLTHVQQLDTKLGQTQTHIAQVTDSQGSLQGQIQRIQSQWDQMQVTMQLDTSAMRQLTAVRQQLSCLNQDVQTLKLSQSQDPDLRQDLNQLRQDLDQVIQALAKQPQRKSLGVFIDGANIHHSARDRGGCLNYPQLINQLAQQFAGADVQPDVFFYSGYDPDNLDHQRFKQSLRAAGFTTKMCPVIRRADGSSKANADGQMIVDMLLGNYDRVLLLSGDGDFVPAVQALRDRGSQVKVAAFAGDTNGTLKTFPFVDLTKLLQAGGQMVDLPPKQVPALRRA